MKNFVIALIIGFLFTVFALPTSATQCNGESCSNVPGHECEHGVHLYNPHCTRSPHETYKPSGSPTPSSTQSPNPTQSPVETSDEDEGSPSATPRQTDSPTQSPGVRTDLSDNRSDGHTESLGCLKASDNCNPLVLGTSSELPSTGGLGLWEYVSIFAAIVLLGIGLTLRGWGNDKKNR